jgi:hypothetical protein
MPCDWDDRCEVSGECVVVNVGMHVEFIGPNALLDIICSILYRYEQEWGHKKSQ